MENNKTENIVGYLESLGFEGEQLRRSVAFMVDSNQPVISVNHKIPFDGEQMHYKLTFSLDVQEDVYKLSGYKVTYRSPIEILHVNYEGIDTQKLDELMTDIDWEVYFNTTESPPITYNFNETIRDVMHQLTLLGNPDNIAALEVQQQLIFKYWPRAIYETYKHPHARNMELQYESNCEFKPDKNVPNATLAYHIVSGNLDLLYEKLETLRLDEFPGIDIDSLLRQVLSKKEDEYQIRWDRNEPEGLIEVDIPVYKFGYDLGIDKCHVTFTSHPPIKHGVFNGIDSEALENKMKKIDWHDDTVLFNFSEEMEVPQFLAPIEEIQSEVYRLNQDAAGAEIADALQLKYWMDASFFEGVIQQTAWDTFNERPNVEVSFMPDYSARAMFNLMCDRAVFDKVASEIEPDVGVWVRLHRSEGMGKPVRKYISKISRFTIAELDRQLTILPIPRHQFYPIRNALLEGERITAKTNDGKMMIIEAHPESSELRLWTEQGIPIPFNFRFDPGWQPPEIQPRNRQQEELKQGGKQWKPHNNRKKRGKGL